MPAAFITNIKRPYDPCKKISFQSTIETFKWRISIRKFWSITKNLPFRPVIIFLNPGIIYMLVH